MGTYLDPDTPGDWRGPQARESEIISPASSRWERIDASGERPAQRRRLLEENAHGALVAMSRGTSTLEPQTQAAQRHRVARRPPSGRGRGEARGYGRTADPRPQPWNVPVHIDMALGMGHGAGSPTRDSAVSGTHPSSILLSPRPPRSPRVIASCITGLRGRHEPPFLSMGPVPSFFGMFGRGFLWDEPRSAPPPGVESEEGEEELDVLERLTELEEGRGRGGGGGGSRAASRGN